MFIEVYAYSQTTISGKVVDIEGESIPGASIIIQETNEGTSTDISGNFTISTSSSLPVRLEIQIIGFQKQTLTVTEINQYLNITLRQSIENLDEIVISASRTPERIRESPVTIERLGIQQIINTSSANFFEGLENLKGVHSNANSLTFKAVNTRGFATFANTRFVQLLDNQDVASPALNFPTGNIVGASDLDVASVELIPGAASALYGANAFNGILFINTKNPFEYEGVSAYVKPGLTVQEIAGTNFYGDFAVRYAKAFNDKFALKFNVGYLSGTDWIPNDTSHQNGTGGSTTTRFTRSDSFYNGLNVYGDEIVSTLSVRSLIRGGLLAAGLPARAINENLIPESVTVSRNGYAESALVENYDATNLKADLGLFYRFNKDLELSWSSRIGQGNSVYQGSNRYALRDFVIHMHKLELKGKNFILRGYGTFEDAGKTYDTRFAGISVVEGTKPSVVRDARGNPIAGWFPEYTRQFVTTYARGYAGAVATGQTPNQVALTQAAHTAARTTANKASTINGKNFPGFVDPNSQTFKNIFNSVINNPNIGSGGAKFKDNTRMIHFEGNYNFQDVVSFAEILVGGSYRKFTLNSSGTIFSDIDGSIGISEYAGYMQISKKILNDRLKLSGSARVDKSQNFNLSFSPRLSAVLSLGENKEHNFRASFQTGFRNPDTQPQYVALDLGNAVLLGTTEDNLKNRYKEGNFTGQQIFDQSFTIASVQKFRQSGNRADLVRITSEYVKQEEIQSYEIGYRGLIGKIDVDFNVFHNEYTDFSAALPAFSLATQKVYSFYSNSDGKVTSTGMGLGLNYRIGGHLRFGGSLSWQNFGIGDSNRNLEYGFNTPKISTKTSFGTRKMINDTWGFSLDYRWSDSYLWESTFADGKIGSRSVVDAQVSYKISPWKSIFKIGGSNILNDEYAVAPGAGKVGAVYYASWTIDL